MKVGRNDPCPCNSGFKYKKCCLNKTSNFSDSDIDKEIDKAGQLSLEHDKKCVEESVRILTTVLENDQLSDNQRLNAKLGLVTAMQHSGKHQNALDILKTLESWYDGKSDLSIGMLIRTAISYNALGHTEEACEICNNILDVWKLTKAKTLLQKRFRGIHLIEFGKAYLSNDQNDKAKECWESALLYLKGIKSELEHYIRAKSNLAFLLLKHTDEDVQKAGVNQLEELSQHKLLIGDLQGVSTNYCNLGTYFRRIGRYERAIAYYRKDLSISRLVGDEREIASSLGNIATLYAEMKQFTAGRELLREAKIIGEELKDDYLLHITKHQLQYLNKLAKEAGLSKQAVGEKALCLCNSGNLYKNCCGKADFEPVDLPHIYGGISEDKKIIEQELADCGRASSPLDFILRNTTDSKNRRAWCAIEGHDGWVSVKELPDMANIHLIAAKEMSATSQDDSSNITKPLSAIILSICHIEAFINQLSYFIYENHEHPEVSNLILPQELKEKGMLPFQRTTQLETKWSLISESLIGQGWLESQPLWLQVKDLIFIRNELVHFKTNGYEQVVPPPSEKELIYKKAPKHIEPREVPHSWPMKLLTPALAQWAVEIVEGITENLKAEYNANRRNK